MKNLFLICLLFTLGESREVGSAKAVSKDEKIANYRVSVDSSSTINGLYKGVKVIPSINGNAFSYKYTYEPKSKIVKIVSIKKIDNSNVEYNIELKDTKGLFDRNSFSIGDDYKYICSYFMLDGIKLPLNKVHALSSKDDFLTQISNIWSDDKSSPIIKLYKIGKKKIFLIKGINPFCNGHNCTDYVVYVLQTENGKGSINAVHFNGRNNPYVFNNFKLFYGADEVNPEILVPKNDLPIRSKLNVNTYKIYFDNIKR